MCKFVRPPHSSTMRLLDTYGRDMDQTTHAPKLPNAHHTEIFLCKTNRLLTTLPLKNPALTPPSPPPSNKIMERITITA